MHTAKVCLMSETSHDWVRALSVAHTLTHSHIRTTYIGIAISLYIFINVTVLNSFFRPPYINCKKVAILYTHSQYGGWKRRAIILTAQCNCLTHIHAHAHAQTFMRCYYDERPQQLYWVLSCTTVPTNRVNKTNKTALFETMYLIIPVSFVCVFCIFHSSYFVIAF